MTDSNDMALVIGIVLAVLALPSLLNGWTEGHLPRFGALMALAGVTLIAIAAMRNPGGYDVNDVLPTFGRVLRGLMN